MNILLRIIHSSVFKSLVTLLFLLVILNATFSIKKDNKGYLTKKKTVHSTFYVSGDNPLNNQKDIPLWASFYSPGIFIRANSSMNYTYSLLAKSPAIRFIDETNDNYKFVNKTLAEQNFMKRHFSLSQVLYENYKPFPIGNTKLKEKEVVKQERIYFTTSSGVIIPELPSFQKFEVVPKFTKTTLRVAQLNTKMPLTSLLESSTSQGLDQKAITAIKQALLKTKTRRAVQRAMQTDQGIIEIEWRVN